MGTYALFERFGVELEYMIVDRETLDVRPVADRLLHSVNGTYDSDVDREPVGWSNELVNHVVELKTSPPAASLEGLHARFHEQVVDINDRLAAFGTRLLPTGAHPWMDPFRDTKLWEHEYREIYHLYNRIFDCRGHGWSNLQSTHINLPFRGDAEFERLHACIRFLLPLIPALAASTPIFDGQLTGKHATRMAFYQQNQAAIPIITGHLVPEQIWDEAGYTQQVFLPIREALRPYDQNKILNSYFVNSRGAIARFDRGAIEIRVMDLQESPRADLALVQLIVATLKALNTETWADLATLKSFDAARLKQILDVGVQHGCQGRITDRAYLDAWGLDQGTATFEHVWQHAFAAIRNGLPEEARRDIAHILERGDLAGCMIAAIEGGTDVHTLYRQLAQALDDNAVYAG